MKILFLDIDGVLNSYKHKALGCFDNGSEPITYGFSPVLMPRLNRIIESVPGLKVILSSSWRLCYEFEDIRRWMKEEGYVGDLHGKTPLPERLSDLIWAGGRRGEEIFRWLQENREEENIPKDVRIAILDDGADMGPMGKYLFQTCIDIGLTDEIVDRVITYFNQEETDGDTDH